LTSWSELHSEIKDFKSKIPILVTSAGVASAVNIIRALKIQDEIPVHIIAIDQNPLASGLYLADSHYTCPSANEFSKYLDFILKLAKTHKIQAIFPCFSKEIYSFANNKGLLRDSGISSLLPDADVIRLCDNKISVKDFVSNLDILVPKTFVNPTVNDLPLFSKKIHGSGSKGATLVESVHMLDHLMLEKDSRIFEMYLKGEEFTVDILCDRNSEIVAASPRSRLLVKDGQTVMGATVQSVELIDYCRIICRELRLVGPCNAQFIKNNDQLYFIEINPRYAAGGLMLTVKSGLNIPLLALKIMIGQNVATDMRAEVGVQMIRYWNEICISNSPN